MIFLFQIVSLSGLLLEFLCHFGALSIRNYDSVCVIRELYGTIPLNLWFLQIILSHFGALFVRKRDSVSIIREACCGIMSLGYFSV